MSDWMPSEAERRRIFEESILPIVFPEVPKPNAPTLLLLGGQSGAGKSRATSRLLSEHSSDMVPLSGDDLRPFHPQFLELARSRSVEAPQILAESTAGWLRDCLVHARTTGRSLLLEGTFHTPDVALGTAELFEQHGFTTRVVVVATPRAESLLAAASRYLLDAQAGRASRFTSLAIHDSGWYGTRELVAELEESPSVGRLTVIARDGSAAFDAERDAGFEGAGAALDRERSVSMSGAESMRWLSELRAMTAFALSAGKVERPVAELLTELHEVALNEVVPRLQLPAGSEARPATEAALAGQLATLRRAASLDLEPVDLAAPVIAVPQSGRGISR
ncbi:zeta toxin family protein [Microbacterium immunditiarum]|uniref:UDP-N-acetylglucosamine kinase n=1 Tax=Microbacterium immunditiarum TaxID=337480 RepID=A0A7Y9GK77_9MICO|nr:zeta toxin family protein [Microbacterium immunditiarum]NYE18047.1 hypothetical protein [Microbacterium immunditiarum]